MKLVAFWTIAVIPAVQSWITRLGNQHGHYHKAATKKSSSATALYSLATQPPADRRKSPVPMTDSTSSEIHQEIESGRVLEGGKVIDFSSVKASLKAETALANARKEFLESGGLAVRYDNTTTGTLLGINQDVVAEVGHPLGIFATPQEIQDCAAYVRSLAPSGLLDGLENDVASRPSYAPAQIRQYEALLERAYAESGEVTSAFAKTFYMGTKLLGTAAQKAIWAVYVWCRRTDEIVDAPRDNDTDMLRDLSSWEIRLERLWKYGEVVDAYDLCLLDCRVKYTNMDITPYLDMIRGMLMDVPGLGQDRYESFDELHLYCYRVAGTVGLMSLPIFGVAPGYSDRLAR